MGQSLDKMMYFESIAVFDFEREPLDDWYKESNQIS